MSAVNTLIGEQSLTECSHNLLKGEFYVVRCCCWSSAYCPSKIKTLSTNRHVDRGLKIPPRLIIKSSRGSVSSLSLSLSLSFSLPLFLSGFIFVVPSPFFMPPNHLFSIEFLGRCESVVGFLPVSNIIWWNQRCATHAVKSKTPQELMNIERRQTLSFGLEKVVALTGGFVIIHVFIAPFSPAQGERNQMVNTKFTRPVNAMPMSSW